MDLQKLTKRAKSGDKEAFREIFELLSDRVFAYAYSRTSNRDDAQDIVQETFIDLWGSLKRFQYKSEEAFYGLVFLIAKRRLYKTYKAYKAHKTVPLKEVADKEATDFKMDSSQYLDKYTAMLAEKYRSVLNLRYSSGMTFAEIAQDLNIKEVTAKVRHHRAIKKLKTILEKYDITF